MNKELNIWHVENEDFTTLKLWRTENNIFQVIQNGEYKPLLAFGKQILIDKKFADIFLQITEQVTFNEVMIFDRELNKENTNYIELRIINSIDDSSIWKLDSQGIKLWSFGKDTMFVSGDLKEELIKIDDKAFEFNLGFSRFAA